MPESTEPSSLPQRDYLDTFTGVLRDAMIRHDGAHRSAKKLSRHLPASRSNAGAAFVRRVRDFGLMAFEQIAINHASRHGMQMPRGDHAEIARWLSAQIQRAPKVEQYHLFRAVGFADAILTNHRSCSGYPCPTNRALCEAIVVDAAELLAQLAVSVRLDYTRHVKNHSFIARVISRLRRDEANFGWEKDVLGRLGFLHSALTN